MAENQTPETPAFNAKALSDADLYAQYAQAGDRGRALATKAELSAEEAAELTELSVNVTAMKDEIGARHAAQAEREAQKAVFADLPEFSAPQTAQESVSEPAAESVTQEPVQVPSVAQMAAQPLQTPKKASGTFGRTVHLSSDAAGVLARQIGEEIALSDLDAASGQLFRQFGTAGHGQAAKRSLGQIVTKRDPSLVMPSTSDPAAELKVLNHVRNERRLDGGSLLKTWQDSLKEAGDDVGALTAAAGWCAPSETDYSLCSLWGLDGLLDLPTTTAPRGGINYTRDFTWAEIMNATHTSFTKLTEAQVIAGTQKNCTELPCPTFTDARLDVAVTCITGSFLQSHAYPEVVSLWRDGLLTKHAYEINKDIIQQILTFATGPVVIPAQGATVTGQTKDTSATASLLAALELAAVDMRERSNMPFGTTLEVILPRWVLTQMRADISRRNAWYGDPFTLSNQTIISWFAVRGIRPQFIRGWQDAQSGGDPANGFPGDITPAAGPFTYITALPTTVNFLIYPAGAIVLAREDVVTLTNVYDSTNLKSNLYTALFTEEAYKPIFPCGEVVEYTAQLCPSGATAHQVYTSCAVPAA